MNELVANCVQFNNFKHVRDPSSVLTEFGAIEQKVAPLNNKNAGRHHSLVRLEKEALWQRLCAPLIKR
jgi:hypothetical protein